MLSVALPESHVHPWNLDQVSTQKDSKRNGRREVSKQKTEDKQGGERIFSSEVAERMLHMREHTHTLAHKHTHIHMHMHIHMHARTKCMVTQYINAQTCTYIHMYAHTYMHAHIDMHAHTDPPLGQLGSDYREI